jgi:UDP-N-acetylglucosamine acyltransferase
MIHSTAIINPKAQLDPTVVVGPYAIIDEGVKLGSGCVVGPYVHLTGVIIAGSNNRFYTGCVIGHEPQDLKYKGQPTRVIIGDNNVFREHVTVHRSNKPEEDTVIGSNNFLMAHSHVGHNAVIGNNVIIANGALIAGHVVVQDRAFISGNCLIHQFVRVGELALMQGGSAISKDLPPFTIARGDNGICGLNVIGLRRNGYAPEQRLELKKLYHFLFRSDLPLREAVEKARAEFTSEVAKKMLDFISTSKRGVCVDKGALFEDENDE